MAPFRGIAATRHLASRGRPVYYAHMMQWQRGFKRIRVTGGAALLLGLALLFSVLMTQWLGYAPNPGFVQIYSGFWPLGLMLVVIGLLLLVMVWVLAGFLPEAGSMARAESTAAKPRFYS